MNDIIETQPDRTDLPLLVIPGVFADMIEPFKAALPMLHDIARVRMYTTHTYDLDEILQRVQDADAVISINVHIPDDMLRKLATHVRVLGFGGTGVANYVNLDLAAQLNMRICNIRHYGNDAVAEFAFALMLELTRHVGQLNEQVHKGDWNGLPSIDLAGKTLAIVGLGGIGKTVARIAQGFGMKVTTWDSGRHDADYYQQLNITPIADMSTLFSQANIISFHMPLNQDTRGMITAAELNAIRPGSILINTARAELIQEGALEQRLAQGDIAAGLDVFYTEPLPADSPLRSMKNVILTPHVAWRSDGANTQLAQQCIHGIASFFTGGDYNVVVNGSKGFVSF